jgi:hypothetical protein
MIETTARTVKPGEHIAKHDLLLSTLHGRYVRFVRWDGGMAVVADRDTLKELPDYVHAVQLRRA